jgi:hypothetical protein
MRCIRFSSENQVWQGFKFCTPFLVWELRRFCSEKVSIVFFDVMIFLVSLSGCVLLGLLLWRHCELCIGWDHSGRQCWGPENRKGPPNTNGVRFPNKYTQVCKSAESRNLRKSILASKVVNPFTCALVHREPKGLLPSEITLESREYSKCEHLHERLLHLVICRTNFIYLQAYHSFTPRTQTFGITPLT